MNITAKTLDHVLTYHPPSVAQKARYYDIARATKELGLAIIMDCPDSREKSVALTKLQETRMWANAAIAINETEIEKVAEPAEAEGQPAQAPTGQPTEAETPQQEPASQVR